jgi:uncharacterized OB-fold protein
MSADALRTSTPIDDRLFFPQPQPRAGGPVHLRISACPTCELLAFPAEPRCAQCGCPTEDRPLTDPAVVVTATTVLYASAESEIDAPYRIAVADFPAGISIYGLAGDDVDRDDLVNVVGRGLSNGEITFEFLRADR